MESLKLVPSTKRKRSSSNSINKNKKQKVDDLSPIQNVQKEILYTALVKESDILPSDCVSIVFEYAKYFQIKDLILFITKKSYDLFYDFRNHGWSDPYIHEYSEWKSWKRQFGDTIKPKQFGENWDLCRLLYAIHVQDTNLMQFFFQILVSNVRQNQKKHQQQATFSEKIPHPTLLNFIILLILISECDCCCSVQKERDKWMSFLLWMLFYLTNKKFPDHFSFVNESVVSSALSNPRTEDVYSLFFNLDYQSNVPMMSTEKVIKCLLVGTKQEEDTKYGQSITRFVNDFTLESFKESRAEACMFYELATRRICKI